MISDREFLFPLIPTWKVIFQLCIVKQMLRGYLYEWVSVIRDSLVQWSIQTPSAITGLITRVYWIVDLDQQVSEAERQPSDFRFT